MVDFYFEMYWNRIVFGNFYLRLDFRFKVKQILRFCKMIKDFITF